MKISSSNVCRTFAYAEDDTKYYIIMEFIKGIDFFEFAATNPKLFIEEPKLVVYILQQILFGIKAIHDAGYVHSDIKPGNVMLALDDQGKVTDVKLIDLGFCRSVEEMKHFSIGTFTYMAPEVAKKAISEPFKTDIWSFGVLIFRTITLEFPIEIQCDTDSFDDVIRNLCSLPMDKVLTPFQVLSKDPTILGVQEITKSCLAVDPKIRPSLDDLLSKIEKLM